MINVLNELRKYEPIELDNVLEWAPTDLEFIFKEVKEAFEKSGKQQFKFSRRLEEMLDVLEEVKQQQDVHRDAQQEIKSSEVEKVEILQGLISICDEVEYMYKYALKEEQGAWKDQLSLQWKRMEKILAQFAIMRIDDVSEPLDLKVHVVKEVKNLPEVGNVEILEILKSGYMYKGKLLRKAEISLNNKENDANE